MATVSWLTVSNKATEKQFILRPYCRLRTKTSLMHCSLQYQHCISKTTYLYQHCSAGTQNNTMNYWYISLHHARSLSLITSTSFTTKEAQVQP